MHTISIFCGLQKLNTLNLRHSHPPLNPRNHFSTVLIKTNWYTISCKYGGCSSLDAIEIPDDVSSIGEGVLADCDALNSIQVAEDNQFYKSVDNCLLSKDGLSLISGCNISIIPDSATSIGKYAFEGCTSLEAIEIPNSVTSIGDGAFFGCSGLKAIKIPDSVTSIGKYAFYGCSSLEAIEIPDSVSSIGKDAFAGRNLIAITIHEKNPVKAFLLIQNAGFIKEHITLNVPIGTGYAYRHTPFFAKFKMIIAKVR